MTIMSKEADRLMNFAAYIFLRNSDSWDTDEATEFARTMFKEFAAVEGITDVNETDDDCDGNCDECNESCFLKEPNDLEIGYNPYIGGYDYDC